MVEEYTAIDAEDRVVAFPEFGIGRIGLVAEPEGQREQRQFSQPGKIVDEARVESWRASDIEFGGSDFDMLFGATCGHCCWEAAAKKK